MFEKIMKKEFPKGAFTAIVTPFNKNGEIDWESLKKNVEFQISQGIKGLVPVGTTGESPTVTPEEHIEIIKKTIEYARKRVFILAGAGSNSTEEAIHYTHETAKAGTDGVLLVDCYYNGPSSLELRENYHGLIAKKFPELVVCPYVIPGRTGTALSVEDLAILAYKYSNVQVVKEATGDLERMKKTRQLAPEGFHIMSGDDDKTFAMMTDENIKASGVISVITNIAPAAVQKMCQALLDGDIKEGERIKNALDPLFKLVTVKAERKEEIPSKGEYIIQDKFRNPLGIKTMMQGLGMPTGNCRLPLGKMTPQGMEQVRNALKQVWNENPWVLKPIEEFYGANISERLENDKIWHNLAI